MVCGVEVNVQANAGSIWRLLTDATFVLKSRNDGSTEFVMEERFSGLLLPLVKGSMPDFGPVFERYASDLKREAERATY
jgi:hypothetical protein